MAHSDTSSSSCPGRDHHEMDREEMLKELARRTLASYDIDPIPPSEPADEDSEEWGGIEEDRVEEEEEDYSIAGSEEDFDGPEDLHHSANLHPLAHTSAQPPELIVFHDPSRPCTEDSPLALTHQSEKKSFMASMLKKQIGAQLAGATDGRNGKRDQPSDEEESEAQLTQLDRSLSRLITHLTGPAGGKGGLEAILEGRVAAGGSRPQRHPRPIQTAMARAQLTRRLAADRLARAAGTVRPKDALTPSKKLARSASGADRRDRALRRHRADRLPGSTSRGPGGLLKLSPRDIQITNARRPPSRTKKSR